MMMKNKTGLKTSPLDRAERNKVIHQTFMTEGRMVAFPLCFPGASTPILADESHITALDMGNEWIVYGGTSGRRAHLFAGMFNGVTGMVFDLGVVEDADHCAAICCGKEDFFACVNGPGGGRIISRHLQGLPFDLIQEWGFFRHPLVDLGYVVEGERIVHAVIDDAKGTIIGTTEGHVFTFDIESGTTEIVGEIEGSGRLAVAQSGCVVGFDGDEKLWIYDVKQKELRRGAVDLPEGNWTVESKIWAKETVRGRLYTVDGDGRLFSYTDEAGFSKELGQIGLAPVTAMAVTYDGRLFAFGGDGISKMFAYDPRAEQVKDIGAAVSVIERRRYGYQFADAVVGRDGEVYFGENDNLGHLWIYFPAIKRA